MKRQYNVSKEDIATAYALADSPLAMGVKANVSIQDTETAETELAEIFKLIADPTLRERLDLCIGQIARSYELLGFIQGYIVKRTLDLSL